MRMRNRALALGAAALAALAVAVPIVTGAEPGQTVKVRTTLTLNVSGQEGRVKASNPNCVESRVVVLRQQGHGVIGRDVSAVDGSWEVKPSDFDLEGNPPWKVFAQVQPSTQGTAGPIYRCLAAASRKLSITPPDVTDLPRTAG